MEVKMRAKVGHRYAYRRRHCDPPKLISPEHGSLPGGVVSQGQAPKLTVRDRILIHLADHPTSEGQFEVPPQVTQAGLAQATRILQRHVRQYIGPVISEGLVVERQAHVHGGRQRRRAYFLTPAGRTEAARLRGNVLMRAVEVYMTGGTRRWTTLGDAVKGPLRGTPLLELLRDFETLGYVPGRRKGTSTEGPRPYVEMLSEAPRAGTFVGRTAELEAVTRASNRARVFVVRGMAGIGKSCFAAKACEILRGKRNLLWKRIRPWDTSQSVLGSLGDFLAALGKPGLKSVLARGEAVRAREILRSDLRATNSFLVFDDAHDSSKEVLSVLSLVKEAIAEVPGVRALVLTRRALPFYDRREVVLEGFVEEVDLPGLRVEDMVALLSAEGRSKELIALGKKLGGHPLSLELARSSAPEASPRGLRDVRRFLEEEIYRDLSEAERRMMKGASLYQVPVPREALFLDTSTTHDTVLSLMDRSLLRSVGDEAFEVHETIRNFFQDLLTVEERRSLGKTAAGYLQGLASQARAAGNLTMAIDCLSNALPLSIPVEEEVGLWEELGDARLQAGDLPEAVSAYRQGIKASRDTEVASRFHRKMATALMNRSEVLPASREIEAGLRALGGGPSVERGWFGLLRCREAMHVAWEKARDEGLAALKTFRSFQLPRGEGETLVDLAWIELHSPEGDRRRAERHLRAALEISERIGDADLAMIVHDALSHMYTNHLGNVERATEHVDAMETLAGVVGENVLRSLARPFGGPLWYRATFDQEFRADYRAAEEGYNAVVAEARKIHDPGGVLAGRFNQALGLHLQGRTQEARLKFEELSRDVSTPGDPFWRLRSLWFTAECCLLQGDLEGFERIAAAFQEPEVRRHAVGTGMAAIPVPAKLIRGLQHFVHGNRKAALATFEEALHTAEELFEVQEAPLQSYAYLGPLYYGIILRVLGEGRRASRYLRRTRQVLENYNLKARLAFVPTQEALLGEALGRRFGVAASKGKRAQAA